MVMKVIYEFDYNLKGAQRVTREMQKWQRLSKQARAQGTTGVGGRGVGGGRALGTAASGAIVGSGLIAVSKRMESTGRLFVAALAAAAGAALAFAKSVREISGTEQLRGQIRHSGNPLGLALNTNDRGVFYQKYAAQARTGIGGELATESLSKLTRYNDVLGIGKMSGNRLDNALRISMAMKTQRGNMDTLLRTLTRLRQRGNKFSAEGIFELAASMGSDPLTEFGVTGGVTEWLKATKGSRINIGGKEWTHENWAERLLEQVERSLALKAGAKLTPEERKRGMTDFSAIHKEYPETVEAQMNKLGTAWDKLAAESFTTYDKLVGFNQTITSLTNIMEGYGEVFREMAREGVGGWFQSLGGAIVQEILLKISLDDDNKPKLVKDESDVGEVLKDGFSSGEGGGALALRTGG